MSSLFATGSSSKKPYPSSSSTPSRSLVNNNPTTSSSSSRHHQSSAPPPPRGGGGTGVSQLSPDQQTEIREAFELFDLDKDSRLDYHEFKVSLRALGFDLKKAEVLKLMREHPSSSREQEGAGGGLGIGYESFAQIAEELILSRDPLEEIRRAFRLFDEEGNGKISFRNLKKVARELGENLTDDELQAMIEEFDLDQDGEISEHEFINIMSDTS
ncbi:centrin [Sporobolomyces salmoneus]|uniref:centrin n=1 Tax=Sporobolomyces salmoneus TaxID=183962 RepID=UPI003182A87E